MTPTVFIKTLGCKVNTYDSHAIENQFVANGYRPIATVADASLVVINSCSVTANAEKEARYLARRYKRENPSSFLVVTGCYAQTDSAALAATPEINFVVPNSAKEQMIEAVGAAMQAHARGEVLASKLPADSIAVSKNRQSHFKSSLTVFDHAESGQTRVFLKIQDGCNGFCSYCLIPYARGASRSVAPESILSEVERQVALGVREIVLTGIHIGDYGRDLEIYAGVDHPIATVLSQILAISPQFRLRISSLEPSELSQPLLDVLANNRSRICDHFHLPLQSGSDRILKLMRRTYTSNEYREGVHSLRAIFPLANIGADVIPGFPGESDSDHDATIHLCTDINLNYLHVFPYSKRPNTAAERMPHHLTPDVIKARAAALRKLSEELKQKYMARFFNTNMEILWENRQDAEQRRLGHAANYIEVVASRGFEPPANAVTYAKLMGRIGNGAMLAVAPYEQLL